MEVPSGTTRLQIRFDTPARFSTQSIVTGKVADEELVENAVTRAGHIALKCKIGSTFPMHFKSSGRAMNLKITSPIRTVIVKRPTDWSDEIPDTMNTFATRQKTP